MMKYGLLIFLLMPITQPSQEAQKRYEDGQYRQSLALLRSIEAENTGLNYLNQAQNLRRMDSIETAILMYQKATLLLETPTTKGTALNNQAVLLANKGNKNEALQLLQIALRLDPNHSLARRNYEILYQKPKQNPPPPKPNLIAPPPQSRTKNMDTADIKLPTIPEKEAENYLIELNNRPIKYIQQLKKIVKGKPNGPH